MATTSSSNPSESSLLVTANPTSSTSQQAVASARSTMSSSSTSSRPSSSNLSLNGAQLVPTTSATAPTPGRAKRQAQAERSRLVALSKHLMTRLQYATFKVEHGWTKQSLSEVENLYYRQNQTSNNTSAIRNSSTSPKSSRGGARMATATATTSSSSSSSSSTTTTAIPSTSSAPAPAPVTPLVFAGTTPRLFKDARDKSKEAGGGGGGGGVENGDVFGGYGLATPPASGGTLPSGLGFQNAWSAAAATAQGSGLRGHNPEAGGSTTPLSPNRTGGGGGPDPGKGLTSYADFWSRVGTSAPAPSSSSSSSAAAAVAVASNEGPSTDRTRSSEAGSATMAADGPISTKPSLRQTSKSSHGNGNGSNDAGVGSKRTADHLSSPSAAGVAAAGDQPSPTGGGMGSPLKRVRMDLEEKGSMSHHTSSKSSSPSNRNNPTSSSSPLLERGPSFSASARRRSGGSSGGTTRSSSSSGGSIGPDGLPRVPPRQASPTPPGPRH
ncbi:hypothetical protein IE53DRAFT_388883 [Violaceomyces palustris]|uniref:Uncharacterized protein n=1 Tax=Violaceomyces palustris TaxID=1673888 RepID=A0ACD0NSW0_9BASI|nr:hypothetical protein IE53DRAFT_388883 [Violaceomyces palustris]